MTGSICPYCGMPGPDSRDHVMPRSRGVRLDYAIATNNRRTHAQCNHLREHAGECVGALACAFAVADTLPIAEGHRPRRLKRVRRVLKAWRLMAGASSPNIEKIELMRVAFQERRRSKEGSQATTLAADLIPSTQAASARPVGDF